MWKYHVVLQKRVYKCIRLAIFYGCHYLSANTSRYGLRMSLTK